MAVIMQSVALDTLTDRLIWACYVTLGVLAALFVWAMVGDLREWWRAQWGWKRFGPREWEQLKKAREVQDEAVDSFGIGPGGVVRRERAGGDGNR